MTAATMIVFACENCGRPFTVPTTFAGRKATCKTCGGTVIVPHPSALVSGASATGAGPPRLSMRQRRLAADAAQVAAALADSSSITASVLGGDPPEIYRVTYHVRGLERSRAGQPIPRDRHEVEIQLTSDYPRLAPKCRMLTPIFHPNIDPGTICVGDHWTAGERLVDLIGRIGEMICYQAYNIKSPLDGEAAMWADLHAGDLPLDSRNMRIGER